MEAFDHIDSSPMLTSLKLIIAMMDNLVRCFYDFYNYMDDNGGEDEKNRNWAPKQKAKFRHQVLHLIQSILHWGVFSTPSIAFAALVYRAIPAGDKNEVWFFAQDMDLKYGALWGDKLNEKTGYFDSKASMRYFSKNIFVPGVSMRPNTLNQQWLYYLSTLMWARTMVIDSTIKMNKSMIHYYYGTRRWLDFFKLMHDKLESSVNRVSTWRNRLKSQQATQ